MFISNRSMTKFALLGAAAIACAAAPSEATLIAYEGFDYDNSTTTLAGRNGGTGWSAAWANTNDPNNFLTTDDTSIDPPPNPFPAVGDRINKNANNSGTFFTSSRNFAGGLPMNTDGTLYISYSWTKTDGGASADNAEFILIGGATLTTPTPTYIMRAGSTSADAHFLKQTAAGVVAGDNFTSAAGTPTGGTKLFTVIKVTAAAAGTDQIQVIHYNASQTVPNADPVTWEKTVALDSSVDSLTIDQFRLVWGNLSRGQFDEVRIGTTWNDVAVVPEPTSLGLLGLGALTMRRRRRRQI